MSIPVWVQTTCPSIHQSRKLSQGFEHLQTIMHRSPVLVLPSVVRGGGGGWNNEGLVIIPLSVPAHSVGTQDRACPLLQFMSSLLVCCLDAAAPSYHTNKWLIPPQTHKGLIALPYCLSAHPDMWIIISYSWYSGIYFNHLWFWKALWYLKKSYSHKQYTKTVHQQIVKIHNSEYYYFTFTFYIFRFVRSD